MRHVAPNDFYKGDLMRRQGRATLHLSHILLISVLGVYAPLPSAQEIHSVKRFSDGAVEFPGMLPAHRKLLLTFASNRAQTVWQLKFPLRDKNYSIGSPHEKWLKDLFTDSTLHSDTVESGRDLQYYGHRIPLAGWIMLRIDEQAKSHPQITHVLRLVKLRKTHAIELHPVR